MATAVKQKKLDIDMTQGSITRHLIAFSLPLLLGNIFQQLYNMVDTWVVGNFVSKEAMAAVGTVGSFTNMLIGFFLGFSGGAGVVISQYYGAKDYKSVSKAVHTSFVMTILMGILFTFAGIALVPFVLKTIMKMPDEVYPEAKAYLIIYFAGMIGLMIYNIGSGILRSVGDSKRPFYFLVVSAVLNTVLDLVFVLCFHMGVEGVAYATIIAQGVSAVLVVISLIKNDSCVRLYFTELKADAEMLKKIISIGIPSAIQLTVTSFSNMFVYSYINYFGTDMMGGYTAYNKIDQIIMLPLNTISLAITTFAGQNLGVGDIKRTKTGVTTAFWLSFSISAVIMVPVIIFAPELTAIFNNDPEVVRYGTMLLRYITPFFLVCSASMIQSGALRGAGNTKAPMMIMLASYVVFRQIYLYIMANFISNTALPIVFSFPAGWIVCAIITCVYYKRTDLTKNVVIKKDESRCKA